MTINLTKAEVAYIAQKLQISRFTLEDWKRCEPILVKLKVTDEVRLLIRKLEK
jgi:hypothetical protein